MSLQSGKFTPKPLSIMRDVTPDDMMELGNGNGIVYDPSQIDINAKQIQQISEGQLTTTAGHLSLSLMSKISRPKRNTDENKDIEEYLKVRTKYSLSMTKKLSKRSSDNSDQMKKLREMESKLNFKSETIVSQSSAETSLREKLITTKKHLNDIVGKDNFYNELLKYSYDHQNPIYNTLMKALNLEVFLNDDTSHSSITNAIQRMGSVKKLNDVCGENLLLSNQKCHDLLLMLIKAQSNTAQTKLLKSLNEKTSIEDKSEILKLLVQLPKPSNSLITELLNQVRAQTTDTNYEGILLLAISNLAYHSKSVVLKDQISKFLIEKLKKTQCSVDSDNSLIDLLEAIGNLGHNSTIPYSIELGETCFESDSIRIASIHSCRRMISSPEIQKWFLKMIKEPKTNCMIKQEVVNTLIEDINAIDMNFGAINRWPKIEFNEIDNILSENLIRIKHNECLQESIVRYFERKNDEHAKAVLKKVKKLRSKREVFNSFWTEAQCKEWVPQNDKKDEPSNSDGTVVISDKLRESEEVESNVPYRKRRKCSASRRFGPNQAQAVFRADIVNDFSGPDDKPEYKLMAQFAVGTHFLGKDIDIGKMYVYHRKDSSRAYVNMFGNTLVDAAKSSCDETTIQPYVYSNYFPLYNFNIWIVQMTLGIRLTGEMNFDLPKFNCDSKKSEQIQSIKLSPEARVRAAGEVSGQVLVIKGGMNIGGDFNYFSNLEFEPSPELCLSVYNGYKPMNVSIVSWYQYWHPICFEWMDRTIWSPKSLNWQIIDHHRSAWIQNECLIKDSKISKHIEP